jgi:hypothetical protein
MSAFRFSTSVALALGLVACSGADETTGAPIGDSIAWESESFEVPAGESFECFYTNVITDRELSVVSASAEQGPGGHHVTLYYVDIERAVGHEPCSGTTEMTDWHFVVGAGGEGNQLGDFAKLADGLAIKIPEGKQLLIQAHYINTSGETQTHVDKMNVNLIEPADVKAYASDFVVLDDGFEIPPMASVTSTSTCTVESDLQLAMLIGHMHEHGQQYSLEVIDESDAMMEMLYDAAWEPAFASHPPVLQYTMEEPLLLKAGTRLRQTCTWNNTSPDPLIFPTEMCIAFGYYFPGESRIMCEEPAAQ